MSDDFVNAMRQQVLESLSPGSSTRENPLRTIGLSEQILEIGLSDDELYDYCRYQARYLTAQFHRDRPEMQSEEAFAKQHRYEEAFNLIKSNRVVFDEALREFRMLKSAERSSVNFLRRTLASTKQRLSSYQDREIELKQAEIRIGEALEAAEHELTKALKIKEEEAGRVDSLNKDISRLSSQLSHQEDTGLRYRDGYRNLTRYLTSFSAKETSGVHILDVKWVLVAALFHKDNPGVKSVNKLTRFWEQDGGLDLPLAEVKRIEAQWEGITKKVFRSKKSDNVLLNGILRISNCRAEEVLGLPVPAAKPFILGSLKRTPDEIRKLRRSLDRDEVFERMHPWVVPGEVLVLQKFWKLSENRSFENQMDPQPLFDWDTSQIVLAVGS